MPAEVWGTFSVADHLRKRPFVADVLLYDRLVIPIVPPGDEQARERWHAQGRKPEKLDDCLETLAAVNPDLVWTVPWDLHKDDHFRSRFEIATGVAFDVHNLQTSREVDPDRPAFFVTRLILEEFAREPQNWRDLPPGVWVDPMAAYPSYRAFSQEVAVETGARRPPAAEGGLAGVFGWEFVVPEEPAMPDTELLKIAAELASDDEFKKKRRDFHDWRRRVIAEGVTEKTALEEMNELVRQYNQATRSAGLRTTIRNAFVVAEIAAGIVASFMAPPAGIAAAFLAAGTFAAERVVPGIELTQDQRAAAMFHDARKRFGWKPGANRPGG